MSLNLIYRVGSLSDNQDSNISELYPYRMVCQFVPENLHSLGHVVYDKFNSNLTICQVVVYDDHKLCLNALESCLIKIKLAVIKTQKPIEILISKLTAGDQGISWDDVLVVFERTFLHSLIPIRVYSSP